MGLDMYLYLRKHESVGRWDDAFEEKAKGFYPPELGEFQAAIEAHNFLSKTMTYQVGYWRKANEVHHWIVENCASGVDECQTIYVEVEKAKELLDLCRQVLDDHSKAKDLLPTSSGFFFGGTEYDEWYFKDIQYTAELLEDVLKFIESQPHTVGNYWDIIYEASW